MPKPRTRVCPECGFAITHADPLRFYCDTCDQRVAGMAEEADLTIEATEHNLRILRRMIERLTKRIESDPFRNAKSKNEGSK